ncbi:MAG: glycosyltransferase family 4 protein [Myxococcota bacterium]
MSVPQRIAIVTTSYPAYAGDAAGHFVASEAEHLARAGHSVIVFAAGAHAASAGNPRVIWLADGGAAGFPGLKARLRALPLRWHGLAMWLLRARQALRTQGPFDRIVVHWLIPSALPLLLGLDTGAAHIEVVVHGSDARALAEFPTSLTRPLLARLLRRNLRFRCVSHQLADLLRNMAGTTLDGRIHVEPAAIDLRKAPTRAEARRKLAIDHATHLLVIVARLVPEKRVHEALAAAHLLTKAQVVVVGDGPLRAELTHAFPTARFPGQLPREQTLTWIAAADVLLSASRHEGAPTVVREARALGVPVVACASGDLRRWSQSDPGLFVID